MSRRIRYVGDRGQLEEIMNEEGTVIVLHELGELDVNVVDAELELLTIKEAREWFSEIGTEEQD